jgi:hypothetical protein
MTLCMAAACQEQGALRIVALTDSRIEAVWAGANTGYKYAWLAEPDWPMLIAGDLSSAKEFAKTCRSVVEPSEFTALNIVDKISDAALAHKRKLAERLVRSRLSIPFERFVKHGEKEIPSDVRTRLWYDLAQLELGCSAIVYGFLNDRPQIFLIEDSGDVTIRSEFIAIGTGYVVAHSALYYREQQSACSVERTLYNLFEAFFLAQEHRVPGVGGNPQAMICAPNKDGGMDKYLVLSKYKGKLKAAFKRYGPKPAKNVPPLEPGGLLNVAHAAEVSAKLFEMGQQPVVPNELRKRKA